MTKITTAGLCALTLSVALAGCSAKTETKTESASASSAAETSGLAVPDLPKGSHKTIADYVDEHKIVETPVTKDQPGAPTVEFAMPPGWKPAGARKPEWAYGAVIYGDAKDPADPPFMTAIFNKMTGDVLPAKILEYAPGLLKNLPGYTQDNDIQQTTLGGFDAIAFQGSYLRDGVRRYIAQRTVVIPGKDDALYVLQLNADAPLGQDQVILEAAKVIDAGTTITP